MSKHATSLSCHILCLLALALDMGVAALVVITYKTEILLPFPHSTVTRNLQNYLPTFGTLLGGIIAIVNKKAITSLVTIHARRQMARKGLTFKQLSYYDVLSHGSVPLTLQAMGLLAVTLMLAVMVLTTAIVNSLTPTPENWGSASNMSAISFSAGSGVTPPIFCQAGGGNTLYGYGTNCPVDTVYGEMFNAFTDSLRNTFPINSTWDGVSYPSSLMGISASISTLPTRYTKALNLSRLVLPTDTFDVCLPRMVITADCTPNLPNGESFVTTTIDVQGGTPKDIQTVKLCESNNTCVGPRYAPDYGNGVVSVFTNPDAASGNTTVSIFSVGSYATNLTSPAISCLISAQEVVVPIRILGGVSVSILPSLSCSNLSSQPEPFFVQNITRLAGMGLEKMQGADGKLEAIAHIPQGQDRIQAIALGLERMVAVGATQMYATVDALNSTSSPPATWANTESYLLQTIRSRLGVKGQYTIIFVLSPVALIILVLVGWLAVGFSHAAQLGLNPLDPASAIVAGMNRERLPVEIANFADAEESDLRQSEILVRYGLVGGGAGESQRMGIEVTGSEYVMDMSLGPLTPPLAKGGYTDESPMPSPNLNYNGPSGGQYYA